MITKRQRIRAALDGHYLDRLPVACWQHFAYADGDAPTQIESLVSYQERYDWDMVKLMFRSNFLGGDWGVVNSDYEPVLGYLLTERYAVQRTDDWLNLRVLSPEEGLLGEMIEVTRGVRARCGEDLYLLATAFTPIMVASQLSGQPQIQRDMAQSPEAVHAALEVITETLIAFVGACYDAGADGLFFADETAGAGRLTREQYAVYGHPYNKRVLDALSGASDFTMFHVCGQSVYLDEFLDYSVEALNWDHTLDNPSLAEVRHLTGKCLIGGMDKMGVLWKGSPEDVIAEARAAVGAAGREGMILAPGCGVPYTCPEENLRAMRDACDAL